MTEALVSLETQGMDGDLEIIVQDADVEPDRGQSDALNKGFAKSHGEWLFWLNADDVLLPGALKAVKEMVSDFRFQVSGAARVDWIAGDMMHIDVEGKVIDCRRDWGWKSVYRNQQVQVYGPSSFFRRALFEKCGGFDTSLRVCMDVDMWMKFRERGHWYYKLPRYVWGFREHAGSLTRSKCRDADELKNQWWEISEMQKRHGISPSALDCLRARLLRLISGSYLIGAFDTLRYRGKDYRNLHGVLI